MKLEKDQVQFIDTYLENSGVKFLDIRSEMTDHVATALEEMDGDFRNNFKQYMLVHKKMLLQSNRKFSTIAGRNALRLLAGNLVRPRFLSMVAIIFATVYFLTKSFPVVVFKENFQSGFTLFIISLFFYYWYLRISGRAKFSLVNNVLGIASVVIYLCLIVLRPDKWLENDMLVMGYYSLFMAFIIEVLFTFRELMNKYKLQYGN